MDPVVVVGGGLAGMVTALRLAEAGISVDLYEASERLGGKAGSEWREEPGRLGYWSDHGYHVFPAWYHNLWALAAELQITDHFQPRRWFWRHAPRRLVACRPALLSPRSILSAVDLVSRDEASLDGVDLQAFLAGRWYNGPGTGRELRDISLKGLGNPPEEASTVTFRANMRLLLRALHRPNWTAANGSLHERFILPIADALADADGTVTVHLDVPVETVDLTGQGEAVTVDALHLPGGNRVATSGRDVVFALPHRELHTLLDRHHALLPEALAGLGHLESRPMVAADVHVGRTLAHIPPKGHVIIEGSRFHLTLLDIRPVWAHGLPGDTDHAVLQVIAADLRPLRADEDLRTALIDDLLRGLPQLDPADITSVVLHANDDAPLFMNQATTERYRPRSTTAHGTNLFLAGDWCSTDIQLACMEGALVSGTQAANVIRRRRGLDEHDLHLPGRGPSRKAKVLRTVGAPVLWLLSQPLDLYRRIRPHPADHRP